MKKLAVITIVAAFCATMAACNKKTELSISIGTSPDKVNDLVWANGDATWNSTDGYAVGTTTGSKEVDKTSGTITGTIYNGSNGYDVADIVKEGSTDSSFVLSEGSSNTVTIKATKSNASKE
jgi:hypothetical protein